MFHRQFDILRIMVIAINDDQVLESPGDEEFTILQESQIPRAEKRAFSRIRQVSVKSALRILGLVPIALSNALSCYPDLAHLIRWAPGQGFGMDDNDLLISQALPATYQHPGTSILSGGGDHTITLKCRALDGENDRRSSLQATGGDQRRLCQPVAGVKGFSAEAAGSEGCCKALQSLRANRLSASKSHVPTAQVQGCTLLRCDLADAQVIGERRPAARSTPRARDGLQPAQGTL